MKGWQLARLEEIATAPALRERGYWDAWTSDREFGRTWRSIRAHFGIRAFGVNANGADAGHEIVVSHDESGFGDQEELYVVLEGRARFDCDGSEIELGAGELLHVEPHVTRRAVALETPTTLLMIGGTPGKPYAVQDWDRGNA